MELNFLKEVFRIIKELLCILLRTVAIWIVPSFILFLVLFFVIGGIIYILMFGSPFTDWIYHKYKSTIGNYKKELVFDTVCLWLLESMHGYYHINSNVWPFEENKIHGFVLLYEKKYEPTKDRVEVERVQRENWGRIKKFQKLFAKNIAGEKPCLFDYCTDEQTGEMFDLTRDERLAEWLASQQQIVNSENIPIAVRGIDEETVEILWKFGRRKGYDDWHELIVPNASEQELRECKLDDLVKYHEIENCKFKINNCCTDGMYFEFSEVPGYTKEELIEKARELAESMGYKFKVKEIGKE